MRDVAQSTLSMRFVSNIEKKTPPQVAIVHFLRQVLFATFSTLRDVAKSTVSPKKMNTHVLLADGVLATVVALQDLARRSLGAFHCEHSRGLILDDAWSLTRAVMRWLRWGYFTDHPDAKPVWLETYALLQHAANDLLEAGAEQQAMYVDAH